MDGLGLARAIRQRHPTLPVLLVTGYSNAVASAETEFTVLRKPYELAELGRAAAKLVAEAQPPSEPRASARREARRSRKAGTAVSRWMRRAPEARRERR